MTFRGRVIHTRPGLPGRFTVLGCVEVLSSAVRITSASGARYFVPMAQVLVISTR